MARRADKTGKTGPEQLPAEVYKFPQSGSASYKTRSTALNRQIFLRPNSDYTMSFSHSRASSTNGEHQVSMRWSQPSPIR